MRGNYSKTSIPEVPQEQHSKTQLTDLPAVSSVLLPPEHVEQAAASAGNFAVADMHAHGIRGGERTAHVPLRFGNYDVHLWGEHTAQSNSHAEADREGRGDDLVVAAKVDWHKRQPYYARGVHGEGDVFGLVEICGDVAGLEGIISATHDQQAVVAQRGHDTHVAGVADEEDLFDAGVRFDGFGRLHDDEGDLQGELCADQDGGDDQLSPSAHEPGFPGANLLLAARQDTGDAVGFGHQRGVAHSGRESDEQPLEVAGRHGGTGDEGEGAQVAQEDPCQDDVAELPA